MDYLISRIFLKVNYDFVIGEDKHYVYLRQLKIWFQSFAKNKITFN